MKYPYTLSAKVAMFPWKHHMSQSWLYKYYAIGVVATLPIFVWLNGKSNKHSFTTFSRSVFDYFVFFHFQLTLLETSRSTRIRWRRKLPWPMNTRQLQESLL